jgi:hypothetical protein
MPFIAYIRLQTKLLQKKKESTDDILIMALGSKETGISFLPEVGT